MRRIYWHILVAVVLAFLPPVISWGDEISSLFALLMAANGLFQGLLVCVNAYLVGRLGWIKEFGQLLDERIKE